MKTTLVSILNATLLGFASFATGRPYGAAEFLAVAFTVALAGWTVEQYTRKPRPLFYARPIRLPIAPQSRRRDNVRAEQLAA
jgi:hypothetical protein